jgi:hypothetical protein
MKHLHQIKFALFASLIVVLGYGPARAEVRVGGFTDLKYLATDDESAEVSSGFKEGQFVLHLNSALSDRMSVFAEITWTPRSHGFTTEIERAIFKYEYRDALKASGGRYHTPISWWNAAFHHGAWLQTSVDRPIAVKFGSEFVPVHFVGAMAEGRFFPGGLSISYAGGVGNGRGDNISRAGDAGDANNHRALLLQLAFRHDAFYDLQIGGAAYVDRVPLGPDPDLDEQIFSAFVVLSKETPEILGEFFFVRHQDDFTGIDTENTSYYAQVAYRLPWVKEKFKPYARIEEMKIDDQDRAFSSVPPAGEPDLRVPDLHRFVAGIRFDFATMAAIKLEGRRFNEDGGDYINEIYTALNFVF